MVRRVGDELIPNGGPGLGIDQRRMLSGVELALVRNLTDVDGVRQQMVDVSAREGSAAALGDVESFLEREGRVLMLAPMAANRGKRSARGAPRPASLHSEPRFPDPCEEVCGA